MIAKLVSMFIPDVSELDIQCPMCKQTTKIRTIRQVQWRLDCLTCCQTEGVPVVITEFRREEKDRSSFTDFKAIDCKMHIRLPNDHNAYVWKFDYRNNKTTIYKVDSECVNQTIHIFDEILDINLNNFVQKTKMCLLFG